MTQSAPASFLDSHFDPIPHIQAAQNINTRNLTGLGQYHMKLPAYNMKRFVQVHLRVVSFARGWTI